MLQQPCHEGKEHQEQDRPHPHILALQRRWLTHVLQERGDVTHGLVKLLGILAAGAAYLPPVVANNILYVLTDDGTVTAYR